MIFFSIRLETLLCNKSAIRLRAVDLPERVEGAVKSGGGLRVYQECYSKQRTSHKGVFCFIHIFVSSFCAIVCVIIVRSSAGHYW